MSLFLIIVCVIIVISFSIQVFYYLGLFPNALKNENIITIPENEQEPLSIIIAAKNEAQNLKNNLNKIFSQECRKFEVIVVLDQCTDNSLEVLKSINKENLKIFKTTYPQTGKKQALSLGISNASYQKLVFIDADSYPISKFWLKNIANKFSKSKKIVLGLGMFETEPSLLNNFIRYDSQIIALQYISSALKLKPYMGVGRNLAYTKAIWKQNSGFNKHINIASGDDDLFIIEVATKENTAVSTNYQSITLSKSKSNYKSFLQQKIRHVSTSKKYNFSEKIISSAEIISRALFFISSIIFLSYNFHFSILIIFLFRLLFIVIIIKTFSKKINNNISVFHIILFDTFATIFYLQLLLTKALKTNKNKW